MEEKREEDREEREEEREEEIEETSADADRSDDDAEEQPESRRSNAVIPPDPRPLSGSDGSRPLSGSDGSRPLSCPDCGTTFRCRSEFRVHRLRHAETRPFVCSVCEKGFVRKPDLSRHQSRAHHVCPVCSRRQQDRAALTEHLRGHAEEGSLDRASPLLKEAEKPFGCAECGLAFRWRSHLQSHAASVHRGERPHRCSFCGKSFGFRSHLQSHVLVHTGEKPHACSVCGKAFAVKSVLTQHLKIHAADRPFSCSVCDKGFINRKDQAWHQTFVHHLCPVCARRFSDKQALGEHLEGHVEEGALDQTSALFRGVARPFSCSDCGKAFQKKSDLKRHEFSHTGEKPHSCSVCRASFNQRSSLKQHLKTHTGEKPFSCSVCHRGFLVKKDVTWHRAFVHFICPVCSQSFPHKNSLGEHVSGHAHEGALDPDSALFRGIARPFSCSDCGRSFTKNSDLKRHTCAGERAHSSSAV